jgi:hypothetical protein
MIRSYKKILFLLPLALLFIITGTLTGNPISTGSKQAVSAKNGSSSIASIQRSQRTKKQPGQSRKPVPESKTKTGDLIKVTSPKPGQNIKSPLIIEGKARGTWYFEATFPVKLTDVSGKQIAVSYVEAQSEWTTEDFVPFKSSLEFNVAKKTKAFLILERSNASGLPEHDASIKIPVTLLAGEKKKDLEVKAYFGNKKKNPNADCDKVFPVSRKIPYTVSVARAAMDELLKGPSTTERASGYYTSINPGVTVNSLTITNGTAKVDLSGKIEENLGGSCRVAAIRAQINSTLKQFPNVKNVVISVDGRTEDILQP